MSGSTAFISPISFIEARGLGGAPNDTPKQGTVATGFGNLQGISRGWSGSGEEATFCRAAPSGALRQRHPLLPDVSDQEVARTCR